MLFIPHSNEQLKNKVKNQLNILLIVSCKTVSEFSGKIAIACKFYLLNLVWYIYPLNPQLYKGYFRCF